jgi:hypothetical protein
VKLIKRLGSIVITLVILIGLGAALNQKQEDSAADLPDNKASAVDASVYRGGAIRKL